MLQPLHCVEICLHNYFATVLRTKLKYTPGKDYGTPKCFRQKNHRAGLRVITGREKLGRLGVDFDLGARMLEGHRVELTRLLPPHCAPAGSQSTSNRRSARWASTALFTRAHFLFHPGGRGRGLRGAQAGPRLLAQRRPAPPRASPGGAEPPRGAQSATVPACPARANESQPSDSPLPR